ncbi:MAG: gyrase subunit, partial [Verrucomicrobiota bacterium]
MPKKSSPKQTEQSELLLDGAAPAAPVGEPKAEGAPAPTAAPAAASVPAPVAGPVPEASAPSEIAAPPVRRSGEKIQNDSAPLAKSYRNWFLDYASYVILDRAVPHLDDGLKPVQRRVLHTLWDMDDGRFHKVANVVGATMKLHPHGDASIGAALVGIAQRAWLIEPQGNFGNTLTGDDAAAPRYIEARLTPFAREVLFNPKTTTWQQSYDGRNKEPITLPAKFPIVLLEGADGIAVGLSTKV